MSAMYSVQNKNSTVRVYTINLIYKRYMQICIYKIIQLTSGHRWFLNYVDSCIKKCNSASEQQCMLLIRQCILFTTQQCYCSVPCDSGDQPVHCRHPRCTHTTVPKCLLGSQYWFTNNSLQYGTIR